MFGRPKSCTACPERGSETVAGYSAGDSRSLPRADQDAAGRGDGSHVHYDQSGDRYVVVTPRQ
ncbi:hypothetical protein ABT033_37770 [Streptomyces pharetrae]|uniref:hypothetical protein n=1 Tax=Streptomyces pharetrae TaxID=291370 RepID=UPI00336108AD